MSPFRFVRAFVKAVQALYEVTVKYLDFLSACWAIRPNYEIIKSSKFTKSFFKTLYPTNPIINANTVELKSIRVDRKSPDLD